MASKSTPLGKENPRVQGARSLWWQVVISSTGDGMFLTALPLLAATLTRDPIAIAAVTVAGRVPWLMFSLPIGAIADRFDRRNLMVIADTVRGIVVATLAVFVISGDVRVWVLYVCAFVLGAGEVLHANASQALIPVVVGSENLVAFNSSMSAAQAATETFVGPPIGSALFAAAPAMPFVADAVSFGGSIILAARLADVHGVAPSSTRLRDDIREGVRYLWHDAALRRLALMISGLNILWFSAEGVLVLYAFDELHGGKATFTALFLAGAAGTIVMQRFIAPLRRRFGVAGAMIVMLWIWAAATLGLAIATNGGTAVVSFFVIGFGDGLWRVLATSLRQTITPNHLLGRVNSVHRMFGMGAIPIGAALGGAEASLLSVRAPFVVAAVGFGLAAVFSRRLVAPLRRPD
ncbi:MAG TPA: MFS transporter [Acidimicrobiales bacterium]|nr:MFS transporter [Acidimicrobiales bacterium]